MSTQPQVVAGKNTELALMESIHEKYGAEIEIACRNTAIAPAFVAALIANESAGKLDARRFEKNVLAALWEVLLGRKATYGSISRNDLLEYLPAGLLSAAAAAKFFSGGPGILTSVLQRFDDLASSHGLTQIMGYEVFDFSSASPSIEKLHTAEGNLSITILMLQQFVIRWKLDPVVDTAQLFDTWNTGRPHSPTAAPQYIPNGLRRMALYAHAETPA